MLSVCQVNCPNSENEDKIDGPNLPVTLPAILGRGPLLKCADTKVSRRHASLDWDDDDDGITIQALHNNPTFVMVSGVLSSLSKGESISMHHGDMFGLLPNSAWYRICLADNKDSSSSVSAPDCSTAKNSPGESIPLANGSSTANKTEAAGQDSNESTAEEQSSANTIESSIGNKLVPVETDAATASSSSLPAKNVQEKVVESNAKLDENDHTPETSSDVCSTSDGLTNKKVLTRTTEDEEIETPNKKAKIEVNGNLQKHMQAAVSHRARALPSWMKNLDAAPSPAASDSGPAKRGRKKGPARARGGRGAAAASNRTAVKQSDDEDTAPITPPPTNKRRGRKPISNPQGNDDSESEIKPSTSNHGSTNTTPAKHSPVNTTPSKGSSANTTPAKGSSANTTPAKGSSANTTPANGSSANTTPAKDSSANTTPAKDSSANTTPAKDSSANTTPAKQLDGRRKALHYMSDSESDDEPPITPSPAKATRAPPKAVLKSPAAPKVAKQDDDGPSSASVAAAPSKKNGLGNNNDADTDSGSEDDTAPSTSKPRGGRARGTGQTTAAASNTTTAAANTAPAAAAGGARRKACPFGASCYRRNPQHKIDEAHPGDADYTSGPESDDAGSDDDRPECEFGVDCYRRNPQHRREYKHTRLPQPQRRAKRKARAAKKRNGDDIGDSDDSYDYDDPFLNDDSSDDYAPTDSESDSERMPSQPLGEEEKRDLKRMKREAKKFVKGDQ